MILPGKDFHQKYPTMGILNFDHSGDQYSLTLTAF
jgi:hypothetical protein